MPPGRDRHVRLGYALAASAATMWALNGSFSSLLLDDGISAMRLAELRAVLTFVLLAGTVALIRPSLLRVRREHIMPLLPNMTEDIAASIIDWRDTDSDTTRSIVSTSDTGRPVAFRSCS